MNTAVGVPTSTFGGYEHPPMSALTSSSTFGSDNNLSGGNGASVNALSQNTMHAIAPTSLSPPSSMPPASLLQTEGNPTTGAYPTDGKNERGTGSIKLLGRTRRRTWSDEDEDAIGDNDHMSTTQIHGIASMPVRSMTDEGKGDPSSPLSPQLSVTSLSSAASRSAEENALDTKLLFEQMKKHKEITPKTSVRSPLLVPSSTATATTSTPPAPISTPLGQPATTTASPTGVGTGTTTSPLGTNPTSDAFTLPSLPSNPLLATAPFRGGAGDDDSLVGMPLVRTAGRPYLEPLPDPTVNGAGRGRRLSSSDISVHLLSRVNSATSKIEALKAAHPERPTGDQASVGSHHSASTLGSLQEGHHGLSSSGFPSSSSFLSINYGAPRRTLSGTEHNPFPSSRVFGSSSLFSHNSNHYSSMSLYQPNVSSTSHSNFNPLTLHAQPSMPVHSHFQPQLGGMFSSSSSSSSSSSFNNHGLHPLPHEHNSPKQLPSRTNSNSSGIALPPTTFGLGSSALSAGATTSLGLVSGSTMLGRSSSTVPGGPSNPLNVHPTTHSALGPHHAPLNLSSTSYASAGSSLPVSTLPSGLPTNTTTSVTHSLLRPPSGFSSVLGNTSLSQPPSNPLVNSLLSPTEDTHRNGHPTNGSGSIVNNSNNSNNNGNGMGGIIAPRSVQTLGFLTSHRGGLLTEHSTPSTPSTQHPLSGSSSHNSNGVGMGPHDSSNASTATNMVGRAGFGSHNNNSNNSGMNSSNLLTHLNNNIANIRDIRITNTPDVAMKDATSLTLTAAPIRRNSIESSSISSFHHVPSTQSHTTLLGLSGNNHPSVLNPSPIKPLIRPGSAGLSETGSVAGLPITSHTSLHPHHTSSINTSSMNTSFKLQYTYTSTSSNQGMPPITDRRMSVGSTSESMGLGNASQAYPFGYRGANASNKRDTDMMGEPSQTPSHPFFGISFSSSSSSSASSSSTAHATQTTSSFGYRGPSYYTSSTSSGYAYGGYSGATGSVLSSHQANGSLTNTHGYDASLSASSSSSSSSSHDQLSLGRTNSHGPPPLLSNNKITRPGMTPVAGGLGVNNGTMNNGFGMNTMGMGGNGMLQLDHQTSGTGTSQTNAFGTWSRGGGGGGAVWNQGPSMHDELDDEEDEEEEEDEKTEAVVDHNDDAMETESQVGRRPRARKRRKLTEQPTKKRGKSVSGRGAGSAAAGGGASTSSKTTKSKQGTVGDQGDGEDDEYGGENDDDGVEAGDKPRRTKLPLAAILGLREWFKKLIHMPYPTAQEKAEIGAQLHLTYNQVHNWFSNTRKRIYAPFLRKRGIELQPFRELLPEEQEIVSKAIASCKEEEYMGPI